MPASLLHDQDARPCHGPDHRPRPGDHAVNSGGVEGGGTVNDRSPDHRRGRLKGPRRARTGKPAASAHSSVLPEASCTSAADRHQAAISVSVSPSESTADEPSCVGLARRDGALLVRTARSSWAKKPGSLKASLAHRWRRRRRRSAEGGEDVPALVCPGYESSLGVQRLLIGLGIWCVELVNESVEPRCAGVGRPLIRPDGGRRKQAKRTDAHPIAAEADAVPVYWGQAAIEAGTSYDRGRDLQCPASTILADALACGTAATDDAASEHS